MDISAKIPGHNITYGEYTAYKMRTRAGGCYHPEILDEGNTVAWFDADEAYIIKDGANLVSQMTDRTGLGHHLLQATGTNQPLWSSDGVLFDGVDNFMQTGAFTLNQPEQIYFVGKQITWGIVNRFFDGRNDISAALTQLDDSPEILMYAGLLSPINANLALNTFSIIRALLNGASSELIVNETTPVTGDFGANNMGGFTLGARGSTASNFGHIQVKEIIIRKIADTAPNEAIIYNYLKNKHSI